MASQLELQEGMEDNLSTTQSAAGGEVGGGVGMEMGVGVLVGVGVGVLVGVGVGVLVGIGTIGVAVGIKVGVGVVGGGEEVVPLIAARALTRPAP